MIQMRLRHVGAQGQEMPLTKKNQPKNLATTGAHRLCCLQASRTWTLSLSEPFPEVLMTAQTRAVENVDFAKLLTYNAQMVCISFDPDH